MISTIRGMDVYHVSNRSEAVELLREVEKSTSLDKKEITNIVSLNGLSVGDVVRVYNTFTRGGEIKNEKPILRAA